MHLKVSKPNDKALQALTGQIPLIFGWEDFWPSDERLRDKALVGRWYHLKMMERRRKKVEEWWLPILKYMMKVFLL